LSSARNPACTALHLTETCLTSNRRALDVAAMASICQQVCCRGAQCSSKPAATRTPVRGALGKPSPLAPAATSLRQGRSFIPRGPQLSSRRQQGRSSRGASLVVRAESDYYKILGVDRGADKKTIKSAYRQLARKFHPDVNKEAGAEDKFKEISNAYEVLSDEQKRQIYDRFGEAGLKGAGAGGGAYGGGDPFSNPFDIFESFFGGGMGGGMGGMGGMGGAQMRNRPVRGDDERYDLKLNFLEAVFGFSSEIDISRLVTCETCDGSGVKAGTTPSGCGRCGGQGQVVSQVRTPLGTFNQVATCPDCEGSGQVSTPCDKCKGDGRVRKSKRISLKIPAGVDTGSRLRVRGEGNAGRRGGEPGDIYVFISVKDHPTLRRDGVNIHSDVSISYVDAILGCTVKVETVDGSVDLKVPPGTQPDTTLLMAKRGVPRLGNSSIRGDHLVHVSVLIPQRPSKEELKLVEELRTVTEKKKTGIFGL